MKIIKIILTSLIAALACTGIIYAATTVGTNISTTGTLTATGLTTLGNASSTLLSISGTGYIGGANGLVLADGSITDASGSIDFGNENLTTTGTLDVTGLTTLGNASTSVLSVSGNAYVTGTANLENLILDSTGSEAFIVRKNSDGGDVFIIDTNNSAVVASGTIQGILNGRNYLDKWDAKINHLSGASTTAIATMLVLADSWGAHDPSAYHFVARRYWDEYGNAGCGFMIATNENQLYGCSMTEVGTWTTNINTSLDGAIVGSSASATHSGTESLTFAGAATDIVIHYVEKSGGGTFTWELDGGGTNSVDTSAGSSAMVFLAPAGLSGLTDAQHSLEIEVTAGTVEIVGVEFNRNRAGFRMHKAGQGSGAVSAIASSDQTQWQNSVVQLDPDLVLISFGLNDYLGSTEAQYKANLQTVITRVKNVVPDASIIVLTQGDGSTIDLSASNKNYVRAMRDVARENDAGFINLKDILGTYSEANSRGLYIDTLHLNNYGRSLHASAVMDYLDRDNKVKISIVSKNYSFGDDNMTEALDSATYNLAIGNDIMRNVSGDYNTGIGFRSLEDLTSGYGNTSVGYVSSSNLQTGNQNTALGYYALYLGASGDGNTCIGATSCQNHDTATKNTAVGVAALNAATSGGYNVAVGSDTLKLNQTGTNNIAVGSGVLDSDTTGYSNTCVGSGACTSQNGAFSNTALGMQALYDNTGSVNTAIGKQAGENNTTGQWNVYLGHTAGKGSGDYAGADSNTILGADAGYNLGANMDRNIYIGYQAGYNATGNDKLYIDSSNTATPLLLGSFADGSEYLTINGKHTDAPQTTTLASTALALTRNIVYLTCSSNELTTITGGITGQIVTIKFADACTVTDDDSATSNTIDINETFAIFAAKDALQVLYDGTSWYEVGHSDNTP